MKINVKPRELRVGQQDTRKKIDDALSSVRRIVYVDFMGAGKTVVLADLIRQFTTTGKRVLFLVSRGMLLKQAKRQLLAAGVPESAIGVTWANHAGFNLRAPIQIATVQTLARREAPKNIGLIIVDEGHHAPAGQHKKVLGWYPKAKLILATATPIYNGKTLHGHADKLVIGERVEDLIEDGWLVRPEIWTREDAWLPQGLRKGKDGDFSSKAAALSMSGSTIVGGIPAAWKKHAEGMPTLGVAATQEQARGLVEACNDAGVASETLFAEDDESAREAKLARLASGETKIIWTCDVLSEGWDFDGCRCLIMARPTCSITRYLQWCGRVMRRGTRAVILDHAGNYMRCGGPPWIDREWTLDAPPPKTKRHVAKVAPDGRVSFEVEEIEGRLVLAAEIATQTVCAGWKGECPHSAKPNDRAFQASKVLARKGEPWRCGSCSARKSRESLTPEQRSEQAARARDLLIALSPQQRRDRAQKAIASLTPQERSARARKAQASRTDQELQRERMRKITASLSPEQRSERARKRSSAMTQEQRSESIRKGHLHRHNKTNP